MKRHRVIIPSWAELSVEMRAETGVLYPAFIQLAGQPLYSHIIRHYQHIKEEVEILIVLTKDAPELQPEYIYGFEVKTIRLDISKSIGETILAAMDGVTSEQSIIVHMADTLISTVDADYGENVIYVESRSDLYRWTSVNKRHDGSVHIMNDRDSNTISQKQLVCVGVFFLSEGILFSKILASVVVNWRQDKDDFFVAIEEYSKQISVNLIIPHSWNDYGHIDSYYQSKLQFHNVRHFNSLSYDKERGIVTKRSESEDAFRHQIRWFKQVPNELASYLPHIYESNDGSDPHITMELLSIPTLSDLFIDSRLELGAWNIVVQKIHLILNLFEHHKISSNMAEHVAYEIYLGKTKTRILSFLKQCPEASELYVENNGRKFTLNKILLTLEEYVNKMGLLEINEISPIHGDMCFTNLMFDPRGCNIKLIDPRGEFGVPGIYGDPRYDKAKMMHSYIGGYDFIIADRFALNTSRGGLLECIIRRDSYHQKVSHIFDAFLFKDIKERRECEAIQSLLFLSMLPLHQDKPKRQLAMLYIGLMQYAKNMTSSIE